jgi:hypothetical protein
MAKPRRKPQTGSLELSEDCAFQQANWRAERIAWVVMAAIIATAMLGLFSVGPLSNGRATDPGNSIQVEYSRFMRLSAAQTFRIHLAAPSDGFALEFDRAFTEMLKLERVTPEPVRALAGERLRLEFASSSGQPAVVIVHAEPIRFGPAMFRVSLGAAAPAELPVFIHP